MIFRGSRSVVIIMSWVTTDTTNVLSDHVLF